MCVVNTGCFGQSRPCFNRYVTVGFRREGQNHFCCVNRGIELRLAFACAFGGDFVQAA